MDLTPHQRSLILKKNDAHYWKPQLVKMQETNKWLWHVQPNSYSYNSVPTPNLGDIEEEEAERL